MIIFTFLITSNGLCNNPKTMPCKTFKCKKPGLKGSYATFKPILKENSALKSKQNLLQPVSIGITYISLAGEESLVHIILYHASNMHWYQFRKPDEEQIFLVDWCLEILL